MDSKIPKLYTARQAIEILNIGKSNFYNKVASGELPKPVDICGVKMWEEPTLVSYYLKQKEAANGNV